jgi:hypothetical protein
VNTDNFTTDFDEFKEGDEVTLILKDFTVMEVGTNYIEVEDEMGNSHTFRDDGDVWVRLDYRNSDE